MRIAVISDTHGRHEYLDTRAFKDIDMIIHAGDFTGNGSQHQTTTFLQWFESLEVEHKVLIAGNHDWSSTKEDFGIKLHLCAPSVYYLENTSVTINGIKIWGSPYSNQFGHWAWMEDDLDLATIWDTIPEDTNIVVTHGPAYKYNDLVNNTYSDDPNVGSPSLATILDSLPNLKVHVCGHIHEGAGITVGDFLSINASSLDEQYIPINQPIIFTIKD